MGAPPTRNARVKPDAQTRPASTVSATPHRAIRLDFRLAAHAVSCPSQAVTTINARLVSCVYTTRVTTPTAQRRAVPHAPSAPLPQMVSQRATSVPVVSLARPAIWSTLPELDAFSIHQRRLPRRSEGSLVQSSVLKESPLALSLDPQALEPLSTLPTESRTSLTLLAATNVWTRHQISNLAVDARHWEQASIAHA